MFPDVAALQAFAAELRLLQANPSNMPLLWKYGLGPAVSTDALRLLEIRNWLQADVRLRAAKRT
jgi:hypothetical protein